MFLHNDVEAALQRKCGVISAKSPNIDYTHRVCVYTSDLTLKRHKVTMLVRCSVIFRKT